jgi:hypothetical protein
MGRVIFSLPSMFLMLFILILVLLIVLWSNSGGGVSRFVWQSLLSSNYVCQDYVNVH